MRRSRSLSLCRSALVITACAASPARAQCLDWQPGFNLPGVGGPPNAMSLFDDGSGSALYVAGDFRNAGPVVANCVAKWDGSAWSALGSGITDFLYDEPRVLAVAVFDDGSGPGLFVGGWFTNAGGIYAPSIAKWDGANWSDVGLPLQGTPYRNVESLAVFDDGTGPALYMAGDFPVPGAPNSWGIAKWDGSAWTPLGSGFGGSNSLQVNAMTVFDDGSGPALYVGGDFDQVGGMSANGFAKWDGSTWTGLGTGVNGVIRALTVFDDGAGPALYVGGCFTAVGGTTAPGIARWSGSAWSALGSDLALPGGFPCVQALRVVDDGSGPALFAGGVFTQAGGATVDGIARWNGSAWSALGTGLGDVNAASGYSGWCNAIEGFDDGAGPALFAGGPFDSAGGVTANYVARWRTSTWSALGSGNGLHPESSSQALTLFDDGTGPALYVAGPFEAAGQVPAHHIAKWNGSSWSPLGSGVDDGQIFVMTSFDDGSGVALYVGGSFTSIGGVTAHGVAKWDGAAWSPLGSGVDSGGAYTAVLALSSFDDGTGSALYAGGIFTAAGGTSAGNLAHWNGSSWSSPGSLDGAVRALESFDDGSGLELYAAGDFTTAGGTSASRIAKWNGATWSSLGTGLSASASALTAFDFGEGASLYVGGAFLFAGGTTSHHVARWDGSSWHGIGAGTHDPVSTLIGFDDGWGPALYAADVDHGSVGKFDGWTWSVLGGGISGGEGSNHFAQALATGDLDADGAAELYIGGNFFQAGHVASQGLAEWRGCVSRGLPLCFGDASGTPCPCGNSGAPGHGCDNVVLSGGARLDGSGVPSLSADSLVLTSSGERPDVLSLFFQGDHQIAAVFDGDGLRCVGGNLKRLYATHAVDRTATVPDTGMPSISARSAALGDPLFPGARRLYQTYYRDPSPTFCPNPPGNLWNVSSALRIDWLP